MNESDAVDLNEAEAAVLETSDDDKVQAKMQAEVHGGNAAGEEQVQVDVTTIKQQENQVETQPMAQAYAVPAPAPVEQQVEYQQQGAFDEKTNENVSQPVRSFEPPAIFRTVGINFHPKTRGEIMEVINFLLYARIGLFLLSLISWSVAASVNSYYSGLSGFSWLLTIGILLWLFCIANGVLGFLSLGANGSFMVRKVFVQSAFWGDLVFAFMTLSSFSTGATISSSLNSANTSSLNIVGLASVGASAAFMFFCWLGMFYALCLSTIIMKDQHLLLQTNQQQQPALDTEQPFDTPPVVAAV
eukprot:CAMPEP_0203774414 /NCGR_PEP_ID=MMETSP0099_2-20121227/5317_1 /ASSEMBLY_ACC=CAM_ASM_000209 /TAXON_ID=96639 /ORGANISM=" , Strain NY0313808BC1" /LENGTH=300 /DNA_ID=CAMNT_0050672587 /DNA_START=239 /DNA_END=1141 /DNA_ORIENTATION=-